MSTRKSFGKRELQRDTNAPRVRKQTSKIPARKVKTPERPGIIRQDIGPGGLWEMIKKLLKITD